MRPYGEGIPEEEELLADSHLEHFFAMQPERAHLYSIIISRQTAAFNEQLYLELSPLSKFLLIEEDIFREILGHCGLVMYNKDVGHLPLMK